ncbi:MAG: hypothetical protein HYR63_11570 [Proteobacteria bacterium]|nr:hypothetical protein [Pseudomonadota bacterium]MBI3496356.1 hypothetical protein [Pseudomonadota bacterium]
MKRLHHPPSGRHYVASAAIAGTMVALSLVIGVLGYHHLNGLPWIDAFLDASMILGGMGPVNPLKGDAAKLFAACYALFSGLLFIASTAVLVSPWVHRLLHWLHSDVPESEDGRKR